MANWGSWKIGRTALLWVSFWKKDHCASRRKAYGLLFDMDRLGIESPSECRKPHFARSSPFGAMGQNICMGYHVHSDFSTFRRTSPNSLDSGNRTMIFCAQVVIHIHNTWYKLCWTGVNSLGDIVVRTLLGFYLCTRYIIIPGFDSDLRVDLTDLL